MTKKYSLHELGIEVTRRCNKNCLHCMKGDAQNVTITEAIIDKVVWIWDNEFPCDISDEVADFATAFDEHLDTPEEAMYFDSLYQLIMTWWDINDGEIIMPPHYLEKEKRIFWGIEFDNEFYENPVCLPWGENYKCSAEENGDIDYSTELSMTANRDYERAVYQATVEGVQTNVLLLESKSA